MGYTSIDKIQALLYGTLTRFTNKIPTIITAGSNAAMTGLHLRKNCKHWSISPLFVSLDHRIFRDFFDTINTDLTIPRAIQTKAIITFKLKSKIKEGGHA